MARSLAFYLAAACAAVLMLLAPALWNGFPLLEYDTGGYIARWYEGMLEVSRSTVYGFFVLWLARPDFWPAILAQAALTVWVIALILRSHGLGGRLLVLLATVALLSVATTLPWIAGVVLTDIFAGLLVLALYLVALRADTLAKWERAALLVLVAFSAATHGATLAVLAGLLVVGLALALVVNRRLVPLIGLGRGIAALALSAVMLLAANYAVAGRLAWTPGGSALVFGRMLQDGIVARYLAEHCPDPRFKLCDHLDELPDDADFFFWGESVFNRLGRFDTMSEEMRAIVVESLRAYPLWQLQAALSASARQLLKVATGEGVVVDMWHTHAMMEQFFPSALPAMRAARQQKGELHFTAINRLHVPIALVSMALIAMLSVLGLVQAVRGITAPSVGTSSHEAPAWHAHVAEFTPLAVTVALSILGNAVVCGAFANPHDRYGARMVWIATFVIAIVPWRLSRRQSPSGPRATG